ncbi:MAG: hypothetical protein ABIG44_11205 [Planctomycetota bacterium]
MAIMTANHTHSTPTTERLVIANITCICLGLALLIWGLAPALIERILTGRAPHAQSLLLGSTTIILGAIFISLYWPIRQGRRWALWAAFWLALMIVTVATISGIIWHSQGTTLFSLVLAGVTAITTWIALTPWVKTRE